MSKTALTLSGSVEDYDATTLKNITKSLADTMGIDPLLVTAKVLPGSVVLEITMPESTAADLARKINSGEISTVAGKTVEAFAASDLCKTGRAQSPVDIRQDNVLSYKNGVSDLHFNVPILRSMKLENSLKFLELVSSTNDTSALSNESLTFQGVKFTFKRIIFRRPSETMIDNKPFPLEVQVFAKSATAKNLVLSIPFKLGRESPFLKSLHFAKGDLPPYAYSTINVGNVNLDGNLLPAKPRYFHFNGSLTSYPCTEGVQWVVLTNKFELSADQLAATTTNVKSRAMQRLNGRRIEYLSPPLNQPLYLTIEPSLKPFSTAMLADLARAIEAKFTLAAGVVKAKNADGRKIPYTPSHSVYNAVKIMMPAVDSKLLLAAVQAGKITALKSIKVLGASLDYTAAPTPSPTIDAVASFSRWWKCIPAGKATQLKVDGKWGHHTTQNLQLYMNQNLPVQARANQSIDGQWTKAVQKQVQVFLDVHGVAPPLKADGAFGQMSCRGLQSWLNMRGAKPKLVVDGICGYKTNLAMQQFLNAQRCTDCDVVDGLLLQAGINNDRCRFLQFWLDVRGATPRLDVDGDCSVTTRFAVKKFKTDHNCGASSSSSSS